MVGANTGAGTLIIGAYCYHGPTANTLRRTSGTLKPMQFVWDTAGALTIQTAPAGTVDADISDWTTRFTLASDGGGQYGAPTGGSKGAGTVNAAIYDQGNRVHSLTTMFASAEQTITAAGLLTVAHGLGSAPSLVKMYAICKTAEYNWSVNQVVEVTSFASGATGDYGLSWYADSTYIYIRFGSTATNTLLGHNRDTGVVQTLTNANWNLIIKAWS